MDARKFSFVMIGESPMCSRIGEILLEQNHTLLGIVSENQDVLTWARNNRVLLWKSPDYLINLNGNGSFDFLLSIGNFKILEKEILRLPSVYPVNFHDGPLPRYAGLRAPSWALMNGENSYSVTWHQMTDRIDQGAILKQSKVDISHKDTSFSLNLKCFEAGIKAFRELLNEIEQGTLSPVDQDLKARTYYSSKDRPEAGGLIDWDSPAEKISNLIRALDFGPSANPLGTPKIIIGNGNNVYLVSDVEVTDSFPGRTPGTVVDISNEQITVAASQGAIRIFRFRNTKGQSVSVDEIAETTGLKIGKNLYRAEPLQRISISKFDREICDYEDFWIKRFEHLIPINLPVLRYIQNPVLTQDEGICSLDLSEKLKGFLKNEKPQWEPSEFVLSILLIYLSKLSGKEEFHIGYTDSQLLKNTSGLGEIFARSVPLHVNLDSSTDFSLNKENIDNEIRRIRLHQTFPIDLLIRYPVHPAGFNTLLPVQIGLLNNFMDTAPDPSSLFIQIEENSGNLRCKFDSDTFEKTQVENLFERFSVFMESIVPCLDNPLKETGILNGIETKKTLNSWNATQVDFPQKTSIHELFEHQVKETPEKTALVTDSTELTYEELNRRSNQLAHYLRKHGARPGTIVALLVHRSVDMVVGLLGILKAGAAYLPLDPDYPRQRLEFILQDANPSLLVTQAGFDLLIRNYTGQTIRIEKNWFANQVENQDNPENISSSEDLAYLNYTSGSTGRPKGVMIEHRNVVNFFTGMDSCLEQIDARSDLKENTKRTWLAVTSLSFDISVTELLWTLVNGYRVILFTGHENLSSGLFPHPGTSVESTHERQDSIPILIKKHSVTHLQCTPSFASLLVKAEDPAKELSSLEVLLIGGEVFPPQLAHELLKNTSAEIVNMYGPTETTIWSTTFSVTKAENNIPIGRPIANTQIYILDQDLRPVPIGSSGEIFIGGAGVARGYLNRPELTSKLFVPDIFSDKKDTRLFRTGDLGRFKPDGNIEYLGRLDHQIKIHGHRIEPAEIEISLLENPLISEAVVAPFDSENRIKGLRAYISLSREKGISPVEIKRFLSERLPSYMIPSRIDILDSLPRTPNGKVDRNRLPKNINPADCPIALSDPPRTEIEQALAEIWSEVLGIKRINRTDNFFDIGGDSLAAIHMAVSLRQACGLDLSLHKIIGAENLSALGRLLENSFRIELESNKDTLTSQTDEKSSSEHPGRRLNQPDFRIDRRLSEIWCKALDTETADPDANFFDSGGTSLSAVQLFTEIESVFGKELPYSVLLQSPTLKQLAYEIEGNSKEEQKWSPLVPMQPMGTKLPFFFVHASTGNILFLRELVGYLGDYYPFYAFQCPGLSGGQKTYQSIEDLASIYLEHVKKVQPRGPYFIGGFCMGGTIAYEMAQQLKSEGHQLGLIAMVDTFNYNRLSRPVTHIEKLRWRIDKTIFILATGLDKPWRERFGFYKDRLSNILGWLKKRSEPVSAEDSLESFNEKISDAYRPQSTENPVILLRPESYFSFLKDPEWGWSGLVRSGLQIIQFPGNHMGTFVEPHVQDLARELKKLLDEGQSQR